MHSSVATVLFLLWRPQKKKMTGHFPWGMELSLVYLLPIQKSDFLTQVLFNFKFRYHLESAYLYVVFIL